jgi:transposase
MMLHAIDLHKRTLELASMVADGEVTLATASLPAREESLTKYLAQWPASRHKLVVETTGSWYWVADCVRDLGVEFQLAHAQKLQAISGAKVKTDSADAEMLLTLLRINKVPRAHVISPELRELRDLLRLRLRLVEKQTSVLNSIARLLEKYNRASVAELPVLAQVQAQVQSEQLTLLKSQIVAVVKRIRRELKPNETVKELRRIPGIGPISAWTIYLEIDGIERFPSERQFFSYCRVVPGSDNSGERVRSKHSRAGNRYLKLAFSNAAIRSIQRYAEIRTAYRAKLRRKTVYLARAWVRKEIARIVYHVLHEKVEYNNKFKGVPLSRPKKA